MGNRTTYAPGTFSWADLATTDQDAAKRFYGRLFGWEADDMPAGENIIYSMMKVGGHRVAAIAPQPERQAQAGVPPMWQSYVTVEDADASATRAGELGAHVHAEPFDVMGAGRMAVVQDPQGAFVMLWQPMDHIGAGLVNDHGALSWNELASPEPEASAEFYKGLFGWEVARLQQSPVPYWTIQNAGRNNGGIRQPQPDEPPNWSVYFGHSDLDSAASQVKELGGEILMGPMPIGDQGAMVAAKDPQGALFNLYAGHFED